MKRIQTYIFLAGFSITGVEMSASRFLAPYFGSSSIIWANVIGVILFAMALGYNVGGRLADKYPQERAFYGFGAIGAVILGILPFAASLVLMPLSALQLQTDWGLFIASFFATLFLFGVPVFFLAMLSPFAVRLLSKEISEVGSSSGKLSFWSTLGSILGIYVTSLYLVPAVGVRESIWLFALLLFVPSILQLPRRIPSTLGFLALFSVCFWLIPAPTVVAYGTKLHEQESTYQHIKVVEDAVGTRYLYFNEGQGVQSIYNPRDLWTGAYYDYIAPLPLLERFKNKKDLNVLILGYAGGTVGKMLHHGAPEGMRLHIDGVEIDPVVTDLSKKYFGVTEAERIMFTMDGRSFLRGTDKKYDIIIVDAYSQEIYIPPHMITKEFFTEVGNSLTEEGIITFNINAASTEGALFSAAVATVEAAGLFVQDLPVEGSYNHWIFAAKKPIETAFVDTSEAHLSLLVSKIQTSLHMQTSPGGRILTDNNSPIEILVHGEIFSALSK